MADPVGDTQVTTTGSQLSIAVAGGTSHDLWTGTLDAPRVTQSVSDGDFEVTAKFDSSVTTKYQIQGIVVQQDADDLIRFDVYYDGKRMRLFAATISGGSANTQTSIKLGAGVPIYLRVRREGDVWTQSYSFDGVQWTAASSFTHSMNVADVGVFAGNAGGNAPAHTALIDWFRVSN